MNVSDYEHLAIAAEDFSSFAENPFDFQYPPRLIFAQDSLDRLGTLMLEHGGRRALLVSDPGVAAAGHASRAAASLEAAGIEVFFFEEIDENPTTRHVENLTAFARSNRVDCIVGVGGGSAIDTAKGANFLITNGGKMEDYLGYGKASEPMLPMIAVPTTAGTGTETQSFALIVNEKTNQKMACGDKKALCKVVILDPKLTLSKPAHVTAASGIDAISHVVESWVSKPRNAISCMFGAEAWWLLSGAFDSVATSPQNIEARSRMLIGASLAGAAIEHSMLGAAHSCANPLTAQYKTAHGVAVGLMLPHVVRFNGAECDALYAELLARGGFRLSSGQSAAAFLADWISGRLGTHDLPTRLSEIGVSMAEIPDLALQASKQWTAQFNPRRVTLEDFETLYEAAF